MPKKRLISLVCESMTLEDMQGQKLPDHYQIERFDFSGPVFSCQSMWCMQTDAAIPPLEAVTSRNLVLFDQPENFLSNTVKTRIFAHFWPGPWSPKRFDPLITPEHVKPKMEPDAYHYKELLKFLPTWGEDVRWVIYWSILGHCEGYRIGQEDKGVPSNLRDTTAVWMDLVRTEILPAIPKDVEVIMHTDHWSARQGKRREQVEGFLIHHEDLQIQRPTNWHAIRDIERRILCGVC